MSKEIISDMKDKNVLIVGTGKSGKAAAQAMVKLGAHVSIQDNKPEDEVDSQLEAYSRRQESVNCYLGVSARRYELSLICLSSVREFRRDCRSSKKPRRPEQRS